MAVGPDIVTDGLVLALDAANTKSFRGEPTVNVVSNPIPTSGWDVANAQGSTITRTYLNEDGQSFMRLSNVTNGADYPRITDSVFSNTITGVFSTSLEARGTPGSILRLRIYENGSTKITNTITLTSEWVRYKFENQTTSFILNQPYFNPDTTGAIYDVRNIQIEQKPYSTPFVDGTRGGSVSEGGGWKDLSGNKNNGTLVNGPTFDGSNVGSLKFDAVDDSISMDNKNPTDINSTFPNGLTITVALKLTDPFPIPAQGRVIISRNSGASGTNAFNFSIETDRRLRFWIMTASGFPFSTALTAGIIYIVSFTWDRSFGRYYLNGIIDTTTAYSPAPTIANHTNFNIGRWATSGWEWSGDIYFLHFYNRALTPEEILKNYNATKSRFGL